MVVMNNFIKNFPFSMISYYLSMTPKKGFLSSEFLSTASASIRRNFPINPNILIRREASGALAERKALRGWSAVATAFGKHSIRHRRARMAKGLRWKENQLGVIFGSLASMKEPIEDK